MIFVKLLTKGGQNIVSTIFVRVTHNSESSITFSTITGILTYFYVAQINGLRLTRATISIVYASDMDTFY